ncbi:uncharacterized protein BDR25DRAFT_316693 [Lindgomyces ingoldianus]|uniref:Uncharacterized protein n=1 Tax=Lindgomyces ingoldianus TaxID=673940 RepID=A0ACB6QM89_9PLEO|nr:uncharacterized protein BDR25DRAFT_316693 [Lindgomyces ingoldianus]KAF2467693.1 hypothetical protein BDR25DRAFT_316693 [Lindgomyces ingoldianus]
MLGRTILPGDEELGKKDDDHRPGAPGRRFSWAFLKTPLRFRRRRIVLAVVGLYLVYLFIHNIPDLGEFHGRNRPFGGQYAPVTNAGDNPADDVEPKGPPPGTRLPKDGSPPPHSYNGQVRFYRLAESLHASSHTQGYRATNRNVLFAISNLKSATVLLPMICEMSKWGRNWVHAAIMGREDIPLDSLLAINGIDKEKCPAIWHDARPDFTEYSSEARAEGSVAGAMSHIHNLLHPQAIIIDDSLSEDAFFVRAMRSKSKLFNIPIIEVPKDRLENFMWITRLDAGSLKSWHYPTVDILIQAPYGSSGGVMQLLKSIVRADYHGLKPPRLTIELPADVDGPMKQYLENFVWPPVSADNPLATSQMTLRRRITTQRATQEDSSTRFLELFYPTSTTNSHVLLLSPQAELSPLYYHYLKYTLLEYKYSSYGEMDSENMMGISLELPATRLDGKTALKPPRPSDMNTARYTQQFPNAPSVPFLWQAPNSHAALFFADKWAELHSFLSNRVAMQHQAPKTAARPKLVSETLPAWTEYMLEFMRSRGYSLYYPATIASESIATVHSELYHPPEEFTPPSPTESDQGSESPPNLPDEPFLTAEKPPPPPYNTEAPVIPHSRPLHLALPFDGDLPEIPHLPYLLYDGELINPDNSSSMALAYANKFRETVGGCTIPAGKHRKAERGSAKDLFCFGDEDEDDWEDDAKDQVDEAGWDPFGLAAEKKKLEKEEGRVMSEVLSSTPTSTSKGIDAKTMVTAPAVPKE